MLLGIISDTHNDIDATKRALDYFRSRGITFLVHAGDLTSPKMLELFKDFSCRFVLGNGDIDSDDINRKSEELGFGVVTESVSFLFGGKKFFLFHGDNVPLYREIIKLEEHDYMIKGHTHSFEDYFAGKTRVINPGSLYRGEGEEETVAVLNVETGEVEKVEIK